MNYKEAEVYMKKILSVILLILVVLICIGFYYFNMVKCGENLDILIINTNLNESEIDGYELLKDKIIGLVPNIKIKIMHYENITLPTINSLNPKAIILGGQNRPWTEYPQKKLNKIYDVIQNTTKPILGICGGHQLIALAFNSTVSPIKVIDPSKLGYEGCWREEGFITIKKSYSDSQLFNELTSDIIVYENHCDEVKSVPDNFIAFAKGDNCKIQAMEHISKPIYSVQFHPEVYNDEYQNGKVILLNFLQKYVKLNTSNR